MRILKLTNTQFTLNQYEWLTKLTQTIEPNESVKLEVENRHLLLVTDPNFARLILHSPKLEKGIMQTQGPFIRLLGTRSLSLLEGNAHRTLRLLLAPIWTPRAVAEHRDSLRSYLRESLDSERVQTNLLEDAVSCLDSLLSQYLQLQLLGAPNEELAATLDQTWEAMKHEVNVPKTSDSSGNELEALGIELRGILKDALLRRVPKSPFASLPLDYTLDNLLGILLGGRGTGAALAIWTLYELKRAGESMAELEPSRVRSYLTEVLRFYPPAPVIFRTAIKGCIIEGQRIPADQVILISPLLINRLGVERIDSDRFRIGRNNSDSSSGLEFGYGLHACLGRHYAIVEALATLDAILPRYSDLSSDGIPQISIVLSLKHAAGLAVIR